MGSIMTVGATMTVLPKGSARWISLPDVRSQLVRFEQEFRSRMHSLRDQIRTRGEGGEPVDPDEHPSEVVHEPG